jgi:hypothetical protein
MFFLTLYGQIRPAISPSALSKMSKDLAQLKRLLDGKNYDAIKELNITIDIHDDPEWLYNVEIAAYYIGNRSFGYEAFELLSTQMNSVGVPGWIIDGASKNVRWYIDRLGVEIKKFSTGKLHDIGRRLFTSNPSVYIENSAATVVLRMVNYTQTKAANYRIRDPDGVVRTFNQLQQYIVGENLVLNNQKEIIDASPKSQRLHVRNPGIEGFEDCRLFNFNDCFGFTCTMLDIDAGGQPRIALCLLETNGLVKHVRHLVGPRGLGVCEKNWLPFVHNNELLCIYDWNPITILRICSADQWNALTWIENPTFDTWQCDVITRTSMCHGLRGSSSPVRYGDGWLVVTHQYGYEDGRYYYHRFVELDKDFKLIAMSRLWYLDHIGIEFVSGLAKHYDKFIMTFGIEDAEGCYAVVSGDLIRSILKPIQ